MLDTPDLTGTLVTTENSPVATDSPPKPDRREREGQQQLRRWRVIRRVVLVVVVIALAIPAWSLGRVLSANNADPLSVRTVEWARDHHFGGVVNHIENWWYTNHAPPRGGTPKGGVPAVPPPAPPGRATAHVVARKPAVHAPANVAPLAAPPLAGEGVWKPIGRELNGAPVAWATYLRPDPVHTSELIGLVHFNMRRLTATLHAGTDVPGGAGWKNGGRIDPSDYPRVVAAFNSGFKLNGSHGGYFSEGRTVSPLVAGRASFVTYRDGHADVALWGRDATMTPDVTSVRQNLVLLVDHGQLAPDLNSSRNWGATVGSAVYVWRSAVCVDAHHDLTYVAGPALNVATLADVTQRTGCVRAMELDINSWWVSLMTFTNDGHGGVTPWKLLRSMVRSPDRYLVTGTRDFVEIDAR